VYGWEDAVEFILAGASAVQVGSAIGDKWLDVFSEINDGMANYMKRKGFLKISEMVGLAKRF
jgi:dihydroorotate dehydrogenase (NAD+) catalytic subunit